MGEMKHGQAVRGKTSRAYRSWIMMIQRCTNPKTKAWIRYGGQGITVCTEWLDFTNFYRDMGDCPEGMSIDRIDNTKGYLPGNCRWATRTEQSRNQSSNRLITFKGETKHLVDWSKNYGINIATLHNRLERGWDIEKALITPTVSIKTVCPQCGSNQTKKNGRRNNKQTFICNSCNKWFTA